MREYYSSDNQERDDYISARQFSVNSNNAIARYMNSDEWLTVSINEYAYKAHAELKGEINADSE